MKTIIMLIAALLLLTVPVVAGPPNEDCLSCIDNCVQKHCLKNGFIWRCAKECEQGCIRDGYCEEDGGPGGQVFQIGNATFVVDTVIEESD